MSKLTELIVYELGNITPTLKKDCVDFSDALVERIKIFWSPDMPTSTIDCDNYINFCNMIDKAYEEIKGEISLIEKIDIRSDYETKTD